MQGMKRMVTTSPSVRIGPAAIGLALLALVLSDVSAAQGQATQMPRQTLAQPGPEGVTVLAPDIDPEAGARAEAALADVAWHAAYAEGPEGRSGVWTAAHTIELARDYALAACGEGCSVLAERRPLHAPDGPGLRTILLQPEMTRRIGRQGPYLGRAHILAIGGAGAWGTGHDAGRRGIVSVATDRALAECEARRSAERTPPRLVSPPCRITSLADAEITDLRPETPLYPAPFIVDLATLTAAPDEALRVMRADGTYWDGTDARWWPDGLNGTVATNGAGAEGLVQSGGWPEGAEAMALALCEAARRFGDPPCAIWLRRVPPAPPREGTLAVTPDLLADFRIWQGMEGAGAFAIGPLGAYGSSRGFATIEEARQHAADWCAHYSRRSSGAFDLRRAFIDQPPCRIVAERGP